MRRRSSPFPRYVDHFRDRHGILRTYFRRYRRDARIPLPEPALSEAWREKYRALLADRMAGREPAREIGAERIKAGTVAAGVAAYLGSAAFRGLARTTQRSRTNILTRWRDQWGDRHLAHIERRHIVAWLDERAEHPAGATYFFKTLRALMQYCISIGLIESDPTQGVKPPRYKSDGYHTWTDDEIEQYRRRHPLGTNARLAMELLLGTAQRISDVVRMGRQHVRADLIHVKQQKTGWQGDIPIELELAAALAAVPPGNMTFLMTHWGKPFSADSFPDAMRTWCNEAGLPHCTAHGLRKAAARQLAEAGCTPHEIAAITGQSLKEVQRYTKTVDQRALARAARSRTRLQPKDVDHG